MAPTAAGASIGTIQSGLGKPSDVTQRRAQRPTLKGGVAQASSSDLFKCAGYGKPKAKRWDHRFTEEAKSRKPSSLKAAAAYLSKPGIISLGGGMPTSQYFPIDHIEIKVPSIPHFSEQDTKDRGIVKKIGKYDIAEGKSEYDLQVGLNYGQASGSAQLLRFVTEHTELIHHPPYQDWQCCLDIGNTSGLDMALRMFVNRGDFVIAEEYMFSSAAQAGRPLGAQWIGLPMDAEGVVPSALDQLLASWKPEEHDGKPRPWLLYTVPSGQNPTGSTHSHSRRKDIYRLAQKYDIYIIEDDPYYFLQMQAYNTSGEEQPLPPQSHAEFLQSLVPSYLSMDIDGRVMRLDSFSKVIAPGMRTGWVTASAQVIERFMRNAEVSVQFPAGPSQLILHKLLDETWGHSGFLDWLMHIRVEYTARRDNIIRACEQFLPADITSWTAPTAGMFLWIKVDRARHPRHDSKPPNDIEEEVFQAAIAEGALVCKGSWFRAEEDTDKDELFFRTTFAAAPADAVQEAIRRFGTALRKAFGLTENGDAAMKSGH